AVRAQHEVLLAFERRKLVRMGHEGPAHAPTVAQATARCRNVSRQASWSGVWRHLQTSKRMPRAGRCRVVSRQASWSGVWRHLPATHAPGRPRHLAQTYAVASTVLAEVERRMATASVVT